MRSVVYSVYVPSEDVQLFTIVCLPAASGRFPTVLYRVPYVDHAVDKGEDELCQAMIEAQKPWLDAGYAVVFQHCRGRGKSSGDCIPYIHEREDGLALQAWVREQPFYNGELYLCGGSYCASVHYVTAPFADDIKGAVLEVQDQNRYNCNYRNGFYKMGLHGGWYVGMYKQNRGLKKSYVAESYMTLPLIDFSQTVLGEKAEDFDAILMHPDKDDPFWNTRFGGGEAKDAIQNAEIPILLVTGFYDIYTGGVFDMWKALDDATKTQSALLVHPYAHSGNPADQPVRFEDGSIDEHFGNVALRWIESIRTGAPTPVETGKVTYYTLFDECWRCDDFAAPRNSLILPLGQGEHTYTYNPFAPAVFRGGLSANFGGTAWQFPAHERYDILTFYTDEFTADTTVKGQMTASLKVRSDCEDTCFYMRISLVKEEGDLGLRDDIHAISNVTQDYIPGTDVTLDFTFDEHSFVIRKGEKLRIDVSSAAFGLYVPHTNHKGPFATQTTARIAHNTVLAGESVLNIPTE